MQVILSDAIEQILDSICATLKGGCKKKGPLAGVKEVVRGDRHKSKPKVPALWVFADSATAAHDSALVERWTMPVVISAIVKEDDTKLGYSRATEFAAKARSAVLAQRTLGLRGFVQDAQSERFEPSAPWLRQGNLFSANAVIKVIFNIRE